jgi:aromatic-amino-acid transaminase
MRLDFEGMIATLEQARPGDLILVQASCHNPTGLDLDRRNWQLLRELVLRRGLVPLIDIAYQGFGDGLDDDVSGARALFKAAPEAMAAISASKNFGLYRERTGLLVVKGATSLDAQRAYQHVMASARVNYSMPPDHGAALVRLILDDAELRRCWKAELDAMRVILQQNRETLADLLDERGVDSACVRDGKGMFATLSLNTEAIQAMRDNYAIYVAGGGRINIAGLNPARSAALVEALVSLRVGCR